MKTRSTEDGRKKITISKENKIMTYKAVIKPMDKLSIQDTLQTDLLVPAVKEEIRKKYHQASLGSRHST